MESPICSGYKIPLITAIIFRDDYPSNQSDLRRFFVGPNEAEITGFSMTPDHTSLFLNIQHPVNWPAYDTHDATVVSMNTVRPRSSTVVIQRADGKPIAV